ncbi:hypothetical protein BKA93DRAFT_136760 [Sparassis latifolia]
MNKNPFVTTPAYNPQQPPLPPGPPPPQPAQPDYSAYWAAATAAQHAQTPAVGTFTPHWSTSQPAQPARPTPEQSALYANYGYGGQQNLAWQQQQQQQQRQAQPHFQPPPPVVQPPPQPPPQPAYNPYQPQAGAYQQPYVPQPGPAAQHAPQTTFQSHVPPPQQFQQPQQQPFFHPQQQQPRLNNRNIHQTSPQQFPPAKRPRFDSPNQHRGSAPPQPQFQPPPPPPMQQGGGMSSFGPGPGQGHHSRGGGPSLAQLSMGAGRGGYGGSRGGSNAGRGRGVPMGMNRGGNRSRGGGMYNNMGGRGGGGGGGQGGGSFRGHGSNRGFGNRDNRRGGSFSAGGGQGYSHGYQQQQPHHYQQQNYSSSSFRGRNQGFSSSRGGRHDASVMHSAKDSGVLMSSSFSSGKKDENRRTLTDFKIIGLEIRDLSWSWGVSLPDSVEPAVKVENENPQNENPSSSEPSADAQASEAISASPSVKVEGVTVNSDDALMDSTKSAEDVAIPGEATKMEETSFIPPPPSRIRIYFHTPVTADDAHPITPQSSFSLGSSSAANTRKGKRKKLEDDDGDAEDGRGPPPPPPGAEHDGVSVAASVDYDVENAAGRDSVAPSVAETVSEGDWLMAAIGGEEGEGDGDDSHFSDVKDYHDPHIGGGEYGNGYDDMQGDGHDDYHMLGDDDAQGSVDEQYENVLNAELGSMSSASHGPNGVHSTESLPLNGPADVSSDVAAHRQENGVPAVNGKAHQEVGPEILPDVQSAPPESSVVHDVSAAVVSPSVEPTSVPPADVANSTPHVDAQAPSESTSHSGGAPLQATDSIASTVPDTNVQDPNLSSSTTANKGDAADTADAIEAELLMEPTQPAQEEFSQLDVPTTEPSASPVSHTLVSPSCPPSTTISEPSNSQSPQKTDGKAGKTASANRLSISFAAGTRRLVIDAEIVDKLKVFRGEGRIEVYMNVDKDDAGGFKGIMIEGFSEATSSYVPLEISEDPDADPTVPAFSKVSLPAKVTLIGHLDRERPLSEPKWVKTGDVQEWLRSMFGRMFWVAGDAADGWEKKIEVADPDPPPTIWTLLEAWAGNSSVGLVNERQRFLRTHMTETDNILEILLRLVRGERSSYNQNTPTISAPSVSGPLLSALSQGSAHGAQQTHVSLAVLAIFRLAVEYAKKAAPDTGKGEAEARVGEIIRCLPSHLIYKSLDGIFKEWRVEKKGGR